MGSSSGAMAAALARESAGSENSLAPVADGYVAHGMLAPKYLRSHLRRKITGIAASAGGTSL